METLKWIDRIIEQGLLCKTYISKVLRANSKKQLFEICADANGVSFLCEMREKGYPLDYSIIKKEFGNYINGAYKPFYGEKENGYNSSIYCDYNYPNEITLDTTCTCLLNCNTTIRIPRGMCGHIFIDGNCNLEIDNEDMIGKIYVNVWGDAKVKVLCDNDNVLIRYRK